MLFIDNQGITDPTVNLAIEEYAVTHLDIEESYLLFYINEPSIIIGKNQNTFEEINQEYVRDHGVHIVRRLSGGGAVYHDLGNLSFSFITKNDGDSFQLSPLYGTGDAGPSETRRRGRPDGAQ